MKTSVVCACCGGTAYLLGALGHLAWYRCRACGIDVSRVVRARRKRLAASALPLDGGAGVCDAAVSRE
ncbi:MAG: hypothetical protein MUF54_01515 [Polyangiaceae bacterium]|jgi:hypothetical protein|nr:hypothetical protein [Polyangiaceae bacterium]